METEGKYGDIQGSIFNIQRFCTDDGPGIRTTVFVKGCPLSCAWCHNPESQNPTPQILFSAEKCTGCGACVSACAKHCHHIRQGLHAYDRTLCVSCGDCADACTKHALELCGRRVTAAEVLATVLRDKPFYRDTGGMTLSGGEPMMQPTFSAALCRAAKAEGLHVAMETSGFASEPVVRTFAGLVDLFLFDFKQYDNDLHRKYTGVQNKIILRNLALLGDLGARVILRCPIIPGVNTCNEHFDAIAALANSNKGIREVQMLPYHPLGISKNQRLGQNADYDNPDFLSKEKLNEYMERVRSRTQVTVRQP